MSFISWRPLEISHLRLITGIHQSLEARLDQLAHTTAKNGLLAEEIRLGFFGKSSFEHPGARRAESLGVGERQGFGLPVASCSTASNAGVPAPSTKTSRTR